MNCPFCQQDSAEARCMDFVSQHSGRLVKDGYRVVCNNARCDARGPRRSSKPLAVTAWERAMPAPKPVPVPTPKISYNRLSQQIAAAANSLGDTDDFMGFRWMNIRKVHNCIKEQLRLLKKSGKLQRNPLGEPLLTAEDVSKVFEEAITPFLDRLKKRIKIEQGYDDNGYTDNCLLAFQKICESVWPREGSDG